ncbi:MAG: hypothetical protein M1814_006331 [Vezdaea aestivalis]|nr:MAG: hypothetical protein M1814_006331 [Vezdaea aestivalis]
MSHKRSRAAYESSQKPPQYEIYSALGPTPDPDTILPTDNVPVWKQEVVDEQGRKRLHGAFTGGFSAGYFNTVGSKQGWTPASFVSSRAQRYKDSDEAKQQKPEDFMDEDDLAEQEGAEQLQELEDFAGLNAGKADEDKAAERADTAGESTAGKQRKKPRPRAAFGVGVLNDTGSDDEDPYSLGPQISLNRSMGTDKAKKAKKTPRLSTVAQPSTPAQQSPAPIPPPQNTKPPSPPPPAPPSKSVFDYLTPDARARIAKLTNNPNLPAAKSEPLPSPIPPPAPPLSSSSVPSSLPPLSPKLAQRALLTPSTPYPANPTKAARYALYLRHAAELPSAPAPERQPFQSPAIFATELAEFASAARMFQPMGDFMAGRFSAAGGAVVGGGKVEGGGVRESSGGKKASRAEDAARAGMYGLMTRSVRGWDPSGLLCKRLGCKRPEGRAEDRDIPDVFEEVEVEVNVEEEKTNKGSGLVRRLSSEVVVTREEVVALPPKVEQSPPAQKEVKNAGQAAFKAVFGSDGEDE